MRLQQLRDEALITLDDAGIEITSSGWFVVRAIAMVFDRRLQTDADRKKFSRII